METASPCGYAPTVGACSKEEESDLEKKVEILSLRRLIFSIELDRSECCTPRPRPNFQGHKFEPLITWKR